MRPAGMQPQLRRELVLYLGAFPNSCRYGACALERNKAPYDGSGVDPFLDNWRFDALRATPRADHGSSKGTSFAE